MASGKNIFDEKRQSKEEYLEHKRTLLKMEETNYGKLYLIRSPGGWYKLFSHSALFLSKHLREKVGKSYKLNPDQDYGVRDAKIGSVSIPESKIPEFRQRMEAASIRLVREWEQGFEFEFGERLAEEDVVTMIHEDELMAANANKLVMPRVILSELRVQVTDMLNVVHKALGNQPKVSKMGFLADMEAKAVEMNMMVIAMTRGAMEIDDCLDQMLVNLETMYEYVTTIYDLKMVMPTKYYELVKKLVSVENQIKRDLKKRAIRETEKKIAKTKRRKVKGNDYDCRGGRTVKANTEPEKVDRSGKSISTTKEEAGE